MRRISSEDLSFEMCGKSSSNLLVLLLLALPCPFYTLNHHSIFSSSSGKKSKDVVETTKIPSTRLDKMKVKSGLSADGFGRASLSMTMSMP
jgi:hypothetical protein